jgi:ABC-2 type transport system permease protein
MRGIAAVFYRDYRQRITNIGFMFWDLFAPLAYLILFGLGFERAMGAGFSVEGRAIPYATYLLPGVLSMTAFSVAMNTSWAFFMDKDSGIFYEVLTYPITRRQFLIGKVCFSMLLSVTGACLALGWAALMMTGPFHWHLLPITLLGVMVTTAGWFFFFSIFAIRMNRMDDFNTLTSATYILLMFLSTMFYPLTDLPTWFQFVARLNPMTWQVDGLRWSLLGLGTPSLAGVEMILFGVFAVISLLLAARALNKVS